MKKIKNARERILDSQVQKAYDKYKIYLTELSIYETYIQENSLERINLFRLLNLYKKNGIEIKDRKNIESRFEKLRDIVESVKQKNPDIDLSDISTQKNREIVSNIIYETQKDSRFKTADLNAVAVIENFALYVAVEQIKDNTMEMRKSYEYI